MILVELKITSFLCINRSSKYAYKATIRIKSTLYFLNLNNVLNTLDLQQVAVIDRSVASFSVSLFNASNFDFAYKICCNRISNNLCFEKIIAFS